MMDQETVDAQWPGFKVKCQKCGSTLVELDNSLGFSEMSGSWGSIDFVCMNCTQRVEIAEA